MKTFITVVFVLISLSCTGNEIDNLKTIDDVNAFLKSKIFDKNISFFDKIQHDPTSKYDKVRFMKIDLNNDGRTDLLVNGNDLFAVIDDGTKDFKFCFVDLSFSERKFFLMDIDAAAGQTKIIVKSHGPDRPPELDTLVFKFDGVVEYNKTPDNTGISRIVFYTTICTGECPVFKISLQPDGIAEYNALRYNATEGNFICRMNDGYLNEIFDLVKYINLRKLADHYSAPQGAQGGYLVVKYKNGLTKFIKDDGLAGTFGLQRMYDLLFQLRDTQKWHPEGY
jgi:hypothetical protein